MSKPKYPAHVARASAEEVDRAVYLLLACQHPNYWPDRKYWRERFLELFPGSADRPKRKRKA